MDEQTGTPEDPVDRDRLVADREERLAAHLDATDREAVWFASPSGFAWATGGGSNVVSRTADPGVGAVGYDADGSWHLVANGIEAGRLAAEETASGVRVHLYPWHEGTLAEAVAAVTPTPAAGDIDAEGVEDLDPVPLRQPLAPGDVERYRALGGTLAAAVEGACRELTPGTSERAAGAAVRAACERHDVAADVVLVGGEGRVRNYRHFTPTGDTLGRYALVSVTGTWKGLHASLTRTVAFDPPAWLEERHRDCAAVEAAALAATRRVGCDSGTAGEVFAAITDAYEAAEVPDEWREHHQGGAAGYAGREWFVGPDCDAAVELPMAFAYNPTIQGAKSEDTVLVTDEGVEVLTRTGEWPTVTVEADGGETLERHGVLTVDDGTDQG